MRNLVWGNIAVNETPKIIHQPTITHGSAGPTPLGSHGVMQQPWACRAHAQKPNIQKQTITHEDEKIALVLSLASVFAIWYAFQ